ncbi:MAG TPA: ABC transporter permease subunit [Haloplasmataceae bacterium]
MNIYLHELYSLRKSLLIWSISLVALILIYFAMFSPIVNDAEMFIKTLEGYPESFRDAIFLNIDTVASELGYYSFTLGFVTLSAGIQAMNYGIGIISKELREKTADFLLTKPISRVKIMISKILSSLTVLLLTNIIIITTSYTALTVVKINDFSFLRFLLMSLSIFLIQLFIFSLGVLISVSVKKVKSVLPISLGIVLVFYSIAVFIAKDEDDITRYLTPFRYFDTNYIRVNGHMEISFLIIALIITILFFTSSFIIFKKKDIHAV